jgi:nicotinamide mononucleotide transporter
METIWRDIWLGATGASALEQGATVLGILGVWLMMRQNVWTFPVSLVQVAIFGWVCFQGGLYSETVLQGLFFVALVYGWVLWTRGVAAGATLPVSWLSGRARIGWSGATLVLWLSWSALMVRLGAALPRADAFVFAVSVVAQVLQARKVMENWIGWMIANAVAVGVFTVKGYYWFAVLYGLFGVMAVGGFFEWRRTLGPKVEAAA